RGVLVFSCDSRPGSVTWRSGGPMRHALVMVAVMVCSTPAMAVRIWELNGKHVQAFPHRAPAGRHGGGASSPNITYHNGPVLHAARVVPIFWGPSATW